MTREISFILNNNPVSVNVNPALTVLDFLRNDCRLTGTKEGCREGDCGACTVIIGRLNKNQIEYKSVNSCLMPVADLAGKHLVTVEGLNTKFLNPLQAELVDEGGTQCGFCTPGFVVSMTNYLLSSADYNLESALAALDGNICRCTGYAGIKRAMKNLVSHLGTPPAVFKERINFLIAERIIPDYFGGIIQQLKKINGTKKVRVEKSIASASYLISGGTDLYVQNWEALLESETAFISGLPTLGGISKKGERLFIGGAVTIQQLADSFYIKKYFAGMQSALSLFGSLPIRNRATVAGNLVNASPIADAVNILLALDAEVHLKFNSAKRTIPLKEFYRGYKLLNKKAGELVYAVSVKIPRGNFLFNYEKISRRTYLDIASVNSSIGIKLSRGKIKEVNISAGGVSPIPLRLNSTCSFLEGKEINPGIVKNAASIALSEISPISDARGSANYKSLLLRQLIYAHFIKLFPAQICLEDLI